MNPRRRRYQRIRRGVARHWAQTEEARVELRRKGWSEYFVSRVHGPRSAFAKLGRELKPERCNGPHDLRRILVRAVGRAFGKLVHVVLHRPNTLCDLYKEQP